MKNMPPDGGIRVSGELDHAIPNPSFIPFNMAGTQRSSCHRTFFRVGAVGAFKQIVDFVSMDTFHFTSPAE
jgi:hypothetical protein